MTLTPITNAAAIAHPGDEASWLTPEQQQVFTEAREGTHHMAKTFENWVKIARGVQLAQDLADQLNPPRRSGFRDILRQQRIINSLGRTWNAQKNTASKLKKILANLEEVEDWRASLDEAEQKDWSAPTTIWKHCPVFQSDTSPQPRATRSTQQRATQENQQLRATALAARSRIEELEARNVELEEENQMLREQRGGAADTDELTRRLAELEEEIQMLRERPAEDIPMTPDGLRTAIGALYPLTDRDIAWPESAASDRIRRRLLKDLGEALRLIDPPAPRGGARRRRQPSEVAPAVTDPTDTVAVEDTDVPV